jgi:hypothetical protein
VTVWIAVGGSIALGFALKLAGHLVPARWLAHPRLVEVLAVLPAALLAALVVLQGFTNGRHLVVDARAAGLGVAALALLARAPFLAVVVVAAVTAALVRAAGWG